MDYVPIERYIELICICDVYIVPEGTNLVAVILMKFTEAAVVKNKAGHLTLWEGARH